MNATDPHQIPAGLASGPPEPITGWALARTALLLLLATTAAVGLMLLTRRDWEMGPLPWAKLARIGYDEWALGMVLLGMLLPMALIGLISGTHPFRRLVLGQAARRDRRLVFLAFVVIQLLSLHLYVLTDNEAALFYIVVIAAGLLGGWRMGLGLGLTAYVIAVAYTIVGYDPEAYSLRSLLAKGPVSAADALELVIDSALRTEFTVFPWVGLVTGICASVLGERRYRPVVAFLLGSGIALVGGYIVTGYWDDPSYLVDEMLLPITLLTGLAVLAFALIVGRITAEDVRRRAELAEMARVRAELRALRAQINPHFLFNSLNTIRCFVRKDPPPARRLLIDLSEVYQRAFRAGDFIPLRDEISHVESYLALEKARLDERLTTRWAKPPEALLGAPVPTLILQPIVENAVIHGISPKAEGGTISITIEAADEQLRFEVSDDGAGIAPERMAGLLGPTEREQTSIGVRNVDGRLRALYGESCRLDIQSEPGSGTRVRFRVPIRDGSASEG